MKFYENHQYLVGFMQEEELLVWKIAYWVNGYVKNGCYYEPGFRRHKSYIHPYENVVISYDLTKYHEEIMKQLKRRNHLKPRECYLGWRNNKTNPHFKLFKTDKYGYAENQDAIYVRKFTELDLGKIPSSIDEE